MKTDVLMASVFVLFSFYVTKFSTEQKIHLWICVWIYIVVGLRKAAFLFVFFIIFCLHHFYRVLICCETPESQSQSQIYLYSTYKTVQSALHKIKALQRGAEEALNICKRI